MTTTPTKNRQTRSNVINPKLIQDKVYQTNESIRKQPQMTEIQDQLSY